MSWDVAIQKFSRMYDRIEDIADDESGLPLAESRHFVQQAVMAVFPGTDWRDPAWGIWESPIGSIEFNVGSDAPCDSMMLHVRATPAVVPAIQQLCLANGWQGLDCSSGEFLEKAECPEAGIEGWLAYRARVLK